MKIALIGGGRLPIPPEGWGAVENVIWNYSKYLRHLGHDVTIYNDVWIHETIYEINQKDFDFVHLHWDLFCLYTAKYLKKPFCLTSHCGGFSKFVPGGNYYPAFNYLYNDSLNAPGNIVLSDQIAAIYKTSGYNKFLRILRNPVETKEFSFKDKGNGKAVYLGRIYPRKRQAWLAQKLQNDPRVDFIGPWEKTLEPGFMESQYAKYLGSWTRDEVYQNLTNYSCLILTSQSEAAPLVVGEALASGLSVVVNETSSANLTKEPFVTIIPDDEERPEVISRAIHEAIEKNNSYRKQIRDYAFKRFDYTVVTKEYVKIIEEFIDYNKQK